MDKRIPQIKDIKNAIIMYYSKTELRARDVIELFDCAPSTASRLKKIAMGYITEKNIPVWNAGQVNTKAAYAAWGLDIDDLEKRYNKLKRFEVTQNGTDTRTARTT